MRIDEKRDWQPEYHNRLGYLSYKEVKLPRIPGEKPESTTTVLDLIKQKKSEYYSSSATKDEEETATTPIRSAELPRLRTSVEIYVQTEDPE